MEEGTAAGRDGVPVADQLAQAVVSRQSRQSCTCCPDMIEYTSNCPANVRTLCLPDQYSSAIARPTGIVGERQGQSTVVGIVSRSSAQELLGISSALSHEGMCRGWVVVGELDVLIPPTAFLVCRSTEPEEGDGFMVATQTKPTQCSDPALAVLVVESDDTIRYVLVELLEDEGYTVFQAENLRSAGNHIDATSVPMVLLIGDVDEADYGRLEFFTTVAENPVATHAYIYLSIIPQTFRQPTLVQTLKALQVPTLDMPVEFVSLLSIVASAAERVCSQMNLHRSMSGTSDR